MADKKISQLTAATTPLAGTEVLPIVQGGSTVKVSAADVTAGRAVSAASATISSGDLTFSSTAQKIVADFSNATINNRFKFQTSAANSATTVIAVPSGSNNVAAISAYNTADPTNSSSLSILTTNTAHRLDSGQTGTGPYLPIAIFVNGGETARFFTSGGVSIGDTTDPGSKNFRLGDGNLVVGTAGKGVDFSANTHATGMTKELLDWYEEGAYTPTVASTTGTITSYTGTAWYTRIGRSVTLIANVTITDAGTGAGACTITLPFTNNATVVANGVGRENAISGDLLQGSISTGGTVVNVLKYTNATAIVTGAQIRITITYFV